MIIDENLYNKIVSEFKEKLSFEFEKGLISTTFFEYKTYFNKTGDWDKRKKYFSFEIKIYTTKKNDNLLVNLGNTLVKIGEFQQDNNNDIIHMIADLNSCSQYVNDIRIKLKFISYDMAAKILLNQ